MHYSMIIVTAAILIQSDKILITRRAKGKHLAGFWEFPGGKLESGETEEDCLAREIKEELDICIEVNAFFMDNTHPYSDKTVSLKAYFCSFISGDIVLKDHDKMAWVNKTELDNYTFAPADIPFVEKLKTWKS